MEDRCFRRCLLAFQLLLRYLTWLIRMPSALLLSLSTSGSEHLNLFLGRNGSAVRITGKLTLVISQLRGDPSRQVICVSRFLVFAVDYTRLDQVWPWEGLYVTFESTGQVR